MTTWPSELLKLPEFPMCSRPAPPSVGIPVTVRWYHVELDGGTYTVFNLDRVALQTGTDWEALCDELGWSPTPRPREPSRRTVTQQMPIVPSNTDEPPINYRSACEKPIAWSYAEALSRAPFVKLIVLSDPMPTCPVPPEVDSSYEMLGYRISAKRLKDVNRGEPVYYMHNFRGEVLGAGCDWRRWCHLLGWWPIDGLAPNAEIPRVEAVPTAPRKPTGPFVVNRHWYGTRDEIPEPWMYVGRGTVLGNPFTREEHGPIQAMKRYEAHLQDLIARRDPKVLTELGRIDATTSLVCSCKSKPGAMNPCHADIIVTEWKRAGRRGLLAGYEPRDDDHDLPEWTPPAETSVPTPAAERKPVPQTLNLFGEPP
jgi:hypothetical protein